MGENLVKEYEFFKSKINDLLSDKNIKGRFALIKDKKIQGIYDSLEKAMQSATNEKGYKLGTFLVQKIERQEVQYISRMA